MIDAFIEGNRKFVEEDFKNKKDHYSALSKGQSPKALWIACSDSRVNPERITSAEMGEIFVHRNIGNLVPEDDLNLATVLEYAVNHLKVDDIVVCGHSNCGAIRTLVSGCSPDDRYIPEWLENAKPVLEGSETGDNPPGSQKDVEIKNIREQLENLKGYYMVRDAIDRNGLGVHGVYYDLETGLIEIID
jgi:carbonic anhydrase